MLESHHIVLSSARLETALTKCHALLTPKWTSQGKRGSGFGGGFTGAIRGMTSVYRVSTRFLPAAQASGNVGLAQPGS